MCLTWRIRTVGSYVAKATSRTSPYTALTNTAKSMSRPEFSWTSLLFCRIVLYQREDRVTNVLDIFIMQTAFFHLSVSGEDGNGHQKLYYNFFMVGIFWYYRASPASGSVFKKWKHGSIIIGYWNIHRCMHFLLAYTPVDTSICMLDVENNILPTSSLIQ